mmetsp:Transcript_39777/g.81842  ORF Transcript_39777/g.81842 Transcript_39777/m.81842 type:complete len:561 (+) Transcript_39777:289-1971(+)
MSAYCKQVESKCRRQSPSDEPASSAVGRRQDGMRRRRRPAAVVSVAALVLCPSAFGSIGGDRSVHAFAPAQPRRTARSRWAAVDGVGGPGSRQRVDAQTRFQLLVVRPVSSASSASSALRVVRSPTEADVPVAEGAPSSGGDPQELVADLTDEATLSSSTASGPAADGETGTEEGHHVNGHSVSHDKHVLPGPSNGEYDDDTTDPPTQPADGVIVPEAAALVLSSDENDDLPLPTDHAPHDHHKLPPSERKIWEGATWREKRGLPASHIPEKLFNAALLAVSFGFALYTVINVDSEITRGWTQSEIAMRIPLDTWSSYEASLSSKPIETKTLINVVIYLLGDWLSQTVFQKRDVLDFDARRTLRNGFIGLCFGPLVHQYYEFSDAILPVDVGINRVYKILMDQTIYLFIKCSVYIIAVGTLSGQTFEESTDNAKERIGPIMLTAWKFWPLVHCVTYSVIPAQHRILWVNSVDLVWNAILATKASGAEEEEEDEAAAGEESAELLVAEYGELDGVQVMDGTDTSARAKVSSIESSTTEGSDIAMEEKPRLTLLEQYRRLEV